MATSSFTKDFFIKDEEACIQLIKALKSSKKFAEKHKVDYLSDNSFEEGKKKLVKYFSNYRIKAKKVCDLNSIEY